MAGTTGALHNRKSSGLRKSSWSVGWSVSGPISRDVVAPACTSDNFSDRILRQVWNWVPSVIGFS